MTSEPTRRESTSSPEDSPASPSASPVEDSPSWTTDGSGPSSPDSFAYYDPDTCSLRMCQVSLLEEVPTLCETLPPAGSMRNGQLSERSTLAPLIDASASGLWRTPRAAEAEHPGRQAPPRPGQTLGLTEQVAAAEREQFPTPNSRDHHAQGAGHNPRAHSTALSTMVEKHGHDQSREMFPTPAAKESGRVEMESLVRADGSPVVDPETGEVAWNERWYHPTTGQIVQHGLNQYVHFWPTPTAQDASNDGGPSQYQRNTVPLNAAVKQDETLFPASENPDQLGLFPTPTAADATGSRATKGAARPDEGGLLHDVRKRERIPTPTAGDAKSSGSRNLEGSQAHPGVSLTDYVTTGDSSTPRRDLWPTPKSSPSGPDYARESRESSGGDDLATAVAKESFRTPPASDGRRNGAQTGGQLNPAWVSTLMGYPPDWTELP